MKITVNKLLKTTPMFKFSKALFISLVSLSLLNACTEGFDNVTPGNTGAGNLTNLGDPIVTAGVPAVDQFVSTVYNGKDSNNNVTGVLYSRCSGCHNRSSSGNQSPYFADEFASKAYDEAARKYDQQDAVDASGNKLGTKLFNLTTADASAVVAKVAGGHHCWSGTNDTACQKDANDLTLRIQEWIDAIAGATGGGGGGTSPPPEKNLAESLADSIPPEADPAPSILFPDAPGARYIAADGLHELLTTYCQNCHVSSADTPQTPYFADPVASVSYAALKDNQKIDLNNPEKSRLYLRLLNDRHNCWSICTDDANKVSAAIKLWITDEAGLPQPIPTEWVTSKALTLGDGQEVSGGVRYEPDVIAKFEFKDGRVGDDPKITEASNTSSKTPDLDLFFSQSDKVDWVSGWGVQFLPGGGRLLSGDLAQSRKLWDFIVPNSEFSIETWVVPGNVSQGADAPAVLVAYSGGGTSRNFTLGQQLYNYTLATRLESANADQDLPNGVSELIATPDADEVLQATLQHVVTTYHPTEGRNIYVNGELVFNDPTPPGRLDVWNEGYILSVGADSDGSNPFLGRMRMLAIHNRVMPADKVRQNFAAGVGKKTNLLFKVGHLDDVAPAVNRMHDQSFILLTVEEFDDFSYKLFDPRFVVLGADASGSALTESLGAVTIKGMRIGIEGKEPEVGQAFGRLDSSLSWAATTDGTAVLVPQVTEILPQVQHDFVTGASTGGSTVAFRASGTIIPKASSADVDQFFLTFEDLGGQYARTDTGTPVDVADFPNNLQNYVSGPGYRSALRNFDEIYATMAAITGIDPVTTVSTVLDVGGPMLIKDLFRNIVREALPSVEDTITFVPANQVAISKLAFEFCNALVDDTTARAAFFNVGGTFNFGLDVAAAFNVATDWSGMNIVVNSLTDKVIGTGIGNQPTVDVIKDILTDDPSNTSNTVRGLYEGLVAECVADAANPMSCTDSSRTPKIVKSMCMAVLGGAPMLLH